MTNLGAAPSGATLGDDVLTSPVSGAYRTVWRAANTLSNVTQGYLNSGNTVSGTSGTMLADSFFLNTAGYAVPGKATKFRVIGSTTRTTGSAGIMTFALHGVNSSVGQSVTSVAVFNSSVLVLPSTATTNTQFSGLGSDFDPPTGHFYALLSWSSTASVDGFATAELQVRNV